MILVYGLSARADVPALRRVDRLDGAGRERPRAAQGQGAGASSHCAQDHERSADHRAGGGRGHDGAGTPTRPMSRVNHVAARRRVQTAIVWAGSSQPMRGWRPLTTTATVSGCRSARAAWSYEPGPRPGAAPRGLLHVASEGVEAQVHLAAMHGEQRCSVHVVALTGVDLGEETRPHPPALSVRGKRRSLSVPQTEPHPERHRSVRQRRYDDPGWSRRRIGLRCSRADRTCR